MAKRRVGGRVGIALVPTMMAAWTGKSDEPPSANGYVTTIHSVERSNDREQALQAGVKQLDSPEGSRCTTGQPGH